MDEKVEREIVEHLQNDDMVVRVIDPKSEEMGDGVYRRVPLWGWHCCGCWGFAGAV